MPKHKLVTVNERYVANAEKQIKDFIIDTYVKGEFVALSEIQRVFQRDLKIAEGTINNLLKDLLQKGEISTFYEKGRRYYGPKKIPVSLKTGIAMATIVTFFWVVIDIFSHTTVDKYVRLGSDIHSNDIIFEASTVPFLISSLSIIFIFTAIWFAIDRKKSALPEKCKKWYTLRAK